MLSAKFCSNWSGDSGKREKYMKQQQRRRTSTCNEFRSEKLNKASLKQQPPIPSPPNKRKTMTFLKERKRHEHEKH